MHDSSSGPSKFVATTLASVASTMLSFALLVACSGSGGGTGGASDGAGGDRAGGGAVPAQTGVGGAGVALPPIQAEPTTAPVVCEGGLRPKAYVLRYDSLLEFDPTTLEMHELGSLTCPTNPIANNRPYPWRFTVSQAGFAYVLFNDWRIYRVDLKTLACTVTPYVPGQLSFDDDYDDNMALTPGDDRLYMISDTVLGVSDLLNYQLHRVAMLEPAAKKAIDVKMDAFGRMFAIPGAGYDTLVQLDAATGTVVAEDNTGFAPLASLGTSMSVASMTCRPILLTYDGMLYLIGGCDRGMVRYDLATKTLIPMGQLTVNVSAASATACVHQPNELDAGADAAAAASAPASDAMPFAQGDL